MQFNFDENQHVDNLDIVPEDFQPFYTENAAGGYDFRKDEPAVTKAVSVITGLDAALNAERQVTKQLKANKPDLSPLKEFGTDVASIAKGVNERIEQLKAAGGADADKKIENLKSSMAQAHAAELQAKEKRIEGLTGQLYNQLVTAEATAAIAEHKGNAELLLGFVSQQVKVTEEDGNLKATVVDSNGAPKYSGTGLPMSVTELVGSMKKDKKFAALFQSDSRNGGGTPPESSNTRTPAPGDKDKMSATEKIAAGLATQQKD